MTNEELDEIEKRADCSDVDALLAEVRLLRGAIERARENAKGAWFALEKDPARARFLLDQVENGLGDP